LSWELPELEPLEMPAVLLREAAGDCGQTPIEVRFVELGGTNTVRMQASTQTLKLLLVPDREMNVAWVVVGRATVLIGVFDSRMCSLNSLLREWEIAARDRVQVVLVEVLGLHDVLTSS
jgi:hypothetical protein